MIDDATRRHVRALRRRGLPLIEIARMTGLSKSAAGRMTVDMVADSRAKANRKRAAEVKPPWLVDARRLKTAGLTRLEIARRLDVPKSSVYRWL